MPSTAFHGPMPVDDRIRAIAEALVADPHLACGKSVGATARAVGYRKPGAFADAFRRVTGQHPSVYHGGDGVSGR